MKPKSCYAEIDYESREVVIRDMITMDIIYEGRAGLRVPCGGYLPNIEQLSDHDVKRFCADFVPDNYKLQAVKREP